MEQIIYENVLFASFVAMYIFGIFPFLTLSPKGEEYRNYNIARKAFGVAMLMWASYVAVGWFLNYRETNLLLASTLNISCYYLGGLLLEFVFSTLLNTRYSVHKRIKTISIETAVFNMALATNYLFMPASWQKIGIMTIAAVFVIRMCFLTASFAKSYRAAIKKADNYYSDNMNGLIQWMPKSIYLVVFLGFSGSLLSFSSINAISAYMFSGIILFAYIFISLQNYMINITHLRDVILIETLAPIEKDTNELETETSIKEEKKNYLIIESQFNEWVANKGFTKQGITIEAVALGFGSNRTYLSLYINATYQTSFREWVALKRIEYSKELLCSDKELKVSTIAEMIGCSSSSFNSSFIKFNKQTPSQWRCQNHSDN